MQIKMVKPTNSCLTLLLFIFAMSMQQTRQRCKQVKKKILKEKDAQVCQRAIGSESMRDTT